MKTIQCAHTPHHYNGFVFTCWLWTASGGVHALLVLEPTECSTNTRLGVLVEHSVESNSNNRELHHWPSIASMSPQSHCGDEEDGRNRLSS